MHLTSSISGGEGIVALYATPNPFLLNKICLTKWCGALILTQGQYLSCGCILLSQFGIFFLSNVLDGWQVVEGGKGGGGTLELIDETYSSHIRDIIIQAKSSSCMLSTVRKVSCHVSQLSYETGIRQVLDLVLD